MEKLCMYNTSNRSLTGRSYQTSVSYDRNLILCFNFLDIVANISGPVPMVYWDNLKRCLRY